MLEPGFEQFLMVQALLQALLEENRIEARTDFAAIIKSIPGSLDSGLATESIIKRVDKELLVAFGMRERTRIKEEANNWVAVNHIWDRDLFQWLDAHDIPRKLAPHWAARLKVFDDALGVDFDYLIAHS